MSEDRFRELAALAALDALDGEDRLGFEAHLAECPDCQDETRALRRVADLLPLALDPVAPDPVVRSRVLGSRRPETSLLLLAAALLVSLGLTVLSWREREAARREAMVARAEANDLAMKSAQETAVLEERLEQEGAFRALASLPGSHLAHLSAPTRSTASVVWDPVTAKGVLVASNLDPLPQGRAYELWVIAEGRPVPAGVFEPDLAGRAVLRLPAVKEIARVKTFAITVEPAAGSPAPTSAIVLAGPSS